MQFSERIIASDALASVPAALERHGLDRRLLLVCDDATWVAAGQQLHNILIPDHEVIPHSLGRSPKAAHAHIEPILVSARAHGIGTLLAVGGGTVNDITKYAAHALKCDYLCVPTAASMNGYSSITASLEVDGQKRSLPARTPKAVIADLTVLAAAPKRLAKAGLGDTLCRSTVAADRYLSHVVFGTPFERETFVKLRANEQWLMGNAALLREGAIDYLRHLITSLLDAGDAMTEAGSSVVASQGEHMIAHTLELMYGREIHDILHGELVAVTTTDMALIQHKMLLSTPQLRHLPREEVQFTRTFGRTVGLRLAQTYTAKIIPEAQVAELNARFARDWPDIKADLLEMIVPASGIERAYKEVGLATTAKGLGLQEDRYNAAQSYAYLTRDRFTFLDLAAMNARRV